MSFSSSSNAGYALGDFHTQYVSFPHIRCFLCQDSPQTFDVPQFKEHYVKRHLASRFYLYSCKGCGRTFSTNFEAMVHFHTSAQCKKDADKRAPSCSPKGGSRFGMKTRHFHAKHAYLINVEYFVEVESALSIALMKTFLLWQSEGSTFNYEVNKMQSRLGQMSHWRHIDLAAVVSVEKRSNLIDNREDNVPHSSTVDDNETRDEPEPESMTCWEEMSDVPSPSRTPTIEQARSGSFFAEQDQFCDPASHAESAPVCSTKTSLSLDQGNHLARIDGEIVKPPSMEHDYSYVPPRPQSPSSFLQDHGDGVNPNDEVQPNRAPSPSLKQVDVAQPITETVMKSEACDSFATPPGHTEESVVPPARHVPTHTAQSRKSYILNKYTADESSAAATAYVSISAHNTDTASDISSNKLADKAIGGNAGGNLTERVTKVEPVLDEFEDVADKSKESSSLFQQQKKLEDALQKMVAEKEQQRKENERLQSEKSANSRVVKTECDEEAESVAERERMQREDAVRKQEERERQLEKETEEARRSKEEAKRLAKIERKRVEAQLREDRERREIERIVEERRLAEEKRAAEARERAAEEKRRRLEQKRAAEIREAERAAEVKRMRLEEEQKAAILAAEAAELERVAEEKRRSAAEAREKERAAERRLAEEKRVALLSAETERLRKMEIEKSRLAEEEQLLLRRQEAKMKREADEKARLEALAEDEIRREIIRQEQELIRQEELAEQEALMRQQRVEMMIQEQEMRMREEDERLLSQSSEQLLKAAIEAASRRKSEEDAKAALSARIAVSRERKKKRKQQAQEQKTAEVTTIPTVESKCVEPFVSVPNIADTIHPSSSMLQPIVNTIVSKPTSLVASIIQRIVKTSASASSNRVRKTNRSRQSRSRSRSLSKSPCRAYPYERDTSRERDRNHRPTKDFVRDALKNCGRREGDVSCRRDESKHSSSRGRGHCRSRSRSRTPPRKRSRSRSRSGCRGRSRTPPLRRSRSRSRSGCRGRSRTPPRRRSRSRSRSRSGCRRGSPSRSRGRDRSRTPPVRRRSRSHSPGLWDLYRSSRPVRRRSRSVSLSPVRTPTRARSPCRRRSRSRSFSISPRRSRWDLHHRSCSRSPYRPSRRERTPSPPPIPSAEVPRTSPDRKRSRSITPPGIPRSSTSGLVLPDRPVRPAVSVTVTSCERAPLVVKANANSEPKDTSTLQATEPQPVPAPAPKGFWSQQPLSKPAARTDVSSFTIKISSLKAVSIPSPSTVSSDDLFNRQRKHQKVRSKGARPNPSQLFLNRLWMNNRQPIPTAPVIFEDFVPDTDTTEERPTPLLSSTNLPFRLVYRDRDYLSLVHERRQQSSIGLDPAGTDWSPDSLSLIASSWSHDNVMTGSQIQRSDDCFKCFCTHSDLPVIVERLHTAFVAAQSIVDVEYDDIGRVRRRRFNKTRTGTPRDCGVSVGEDCLSETLTVVKTETDTIHQESQQPQPSSCILDCKPVIKKEPVEDSDGFELPLPPPRASISSTESLVAVAPIITPVKIPTIKITVRRDPLISPTPVAADRAQLTQPRQAHFTPVRSVCARSPSTIASSTSLESRPSTAGNSIFPTPSSSTTVPSRLYGPMDSVTGMFQERFPRNDSPSTPAEQLPAPANHIPYEPQNGLYMPDNNGVRMTNYYPNNYCPQQLHPSIVYQSDYNSGLYHPYDRRMWSPQMVPNGNMTVPNPMWNTPRGRARGRRYGRGGRGVSGNGQSRRGTIWTAENGWRGGSSTDSGNN